MSKVLPPAPRITTRSIILGKNKLMRTKRVGFFFFLTEKHSALHAEILRMEIA